MPFEIGIHRRATEQDIAVLAVRKKDRRRNGQIILFERDKTRFSLIRYGHRRVGCAKIDSTAHNFSS
jgi:hypothetical protein